MRLLMGGSYVKGLAVRALVGMRVDKLFRYLNRRRVLILAYHGITTRKYSVPCGTQVPLDAFEEQIRHLTGAYRVISLQEVLERIASRRELPERCAVITFDDGYRNNLTQALPVLQEHKVPATMFLTAGYIGSDEILPLDEAYLLLSHSPKESVDLSSVGLRVLPLRRRGDRAMACSTVLDFLKRFPASEQRRLIAILSEALGKTVRFVSEKPEDLKLEAVRPGLDAIDLKETVDFPLINPFFDLAALHLVTTATLAHLRTLYPTGDYDARRFRPNLVLDTPGEIGFLEESWMGKTLAVGPEVRVRIFMRTHRCAATTLPHHGLPNDPEILRAANRHNNGNVGVYAAVETPGMVRVGDVVEVI